MAPISRERSRTQQLNLRLTPDELGVIRDAAQRYGMTVTQLMVRATLDKINDKDHPFTGTLRRMRESGEVQ